MAAAPFFDGIEVPDGGDNEAEAPTRAPSPILVGAFGVLAASIGVSLIDSDRAALVAYVLSGVVTPALVAWYRTVDRTRRRSPQYVYLSTHRVLTNLFQIVAVVLAVFYAYDFATSSHVQA